MPRAAIATADRPKRTYTRRQPAAPTIVPAEKRETHSTDFQIGQHKSITDSTPRNDVGREKANVQRLYGNRLKYQGDLILLDKIEVDQAYLDELAFNEEPVTIMIHPSSHKNAASIFENWSNGQGAEMFINGRWLVIRDLPVGKEITVKRKIVEQIIRARVMSVRTVHEEATVDSPRNDLIRQSAAVHSFSIIRDASPKSATWLEAAYASPI